MAERLIAEGNEILAVDINEERVNDAIDMVTDAQMAMLPMNILWNLWE